MEWSNLKVTSKDVLAALIFTFTASGVYYKLYYEGKLTNETDAIRITNLENEVRVLKQENAAFKDWQRKIDDDNLRRHTLEEETYKVYVPLKKTK